MLRTMVAVAGMLLLTSCSSSGGGGEGQEEERQRCSSSRDCRVPTPLCDEGFCVACTETAHCTAERPFCIDGACWGRECTGAADCGLSAPVCDAGICTACTSDASCGVGGSCRADGSCGEPAPSVIFVIDHSATMNACVEGTALLGSCDSNFDGSLDSDASSRWDLVRNVLAAPNWAGDRDAFGLVVTNRGGGDDPACGLPAVLVEPARGNEESFVEALESEALANPQGGTPTAVALEAAADLLGPGAKATVVLITDGLMNCDVDHPMPCRCANESGCPDESGGMARLMEEGVFLDGRFCVDDDGVLAAVQRLGRSGARTAIVAVMASPPAIDELSPSAAAGGLPSSDWSGVHQVSNETNLRAALESILSTR